jgi:hypothetical protein
MKKDDSSFLQGVESRLDSLFADDFESRKEKKDETPRPELSSQEEPKDTVSPDEVSPRVPEKDESDFQELTPETKKDMDQDVQPASASGAQSEKSAFISEIEKRFSAIFGEDIEEPPPDSSTSVKPQVIPVAVAAAPAKDEVRAAQKPAAPPSAALESDLLFEEAPSPNAVLASPLKNIKSIVLSIEWEISDEILEQFEEELNKLYLLYTGDKVILGFLRILRFLGRYIRVRGANSNQESINLLLSVYDHLENVMVVPDMTEVKKHLSLLENVKKYRAWVETTDLETQPGDRPETEPPVEDVSLSVEEPLLQEAPDVEPARIEPVKAPMPELEALDISGDSLKPISELTEVLQTPEPAETESRIPERESVEEAGKSLAADVFDMEEPLVLEKDLPVELPAQQPAEDEMMKAKIETIRELAPQEAFAYALEELKKTFSEDIRRMQQDIQDLKNALKIER